MVLRAVLPRQAVFLLHALPDCHGWAPLAPRELVSARPRLRASPAAGRPGVRMSHPHVGPDGSVNLPSNHGKKADAYGPVRATHARTHARTHAASPSLTLDAEHRGDYPIAQFVVSMGCDCLARAPACAVRATKRGG